MRTRSVITAILTIAALATAVAAFTVGSRAPRVERVDFDRVVRGVSPAYDARLAPASDAGIKEFRIPIKDATVEIADGESFHAWTFGGTVPGPVLRVRQGDRVRITVVNEAGMPHSIDFHAARIPANVAYRMINPRDSISFEFVARDPGAFMVHCGTPPVTLHLTQGMYFAIIVDPEGGWGTKADKEFVLVQSEFYAKAADTSAAMQGDRMSSHNMPMAMPAPISATATTVMQADWKSETEKNASHVVFNGRAFQYKDHPLKVDVGDRVRFFVVNAGPNFDSDFHIVGAIFDRVYPDGNPGHALTGVQTYLIPAGGGAVFETRFDKDASGEGIYAFVTHSFADAEKGAVGMIQVGTPTQFPTMVH